MRILHVLNSTKGGSTVSAVELVKSSRAAETGIRHFAIYPGQRGVADPTIHSTFHKARPIPLPAWNRPKNLDPVRRFATAILVARNTRFGLRTKSALETAIRDWRPDLVTTNCAANIHGALAAGRAGLPHIWHIRERIGTDGSMDFRLNDKRLVHRIAGLSTGIAAVSEYVAGPFRKNGADDSLQVVYDGVDVEAFAGAAARKRGLALRKKWGIPGDALLVGKVANVTSVVKRHDLFLRAVAEIVRKNREVSFVVVGSTPDGSRWINRPSEVRWHNLKKLSHELDLDERLIWAGNVDDPPAVMNAIDILAHACDIEGFPRVVIEAMAAGKPVVGPDSGGVPEGTGTVAGLLVAPGSVEALADGILALVNDAKVRQQIGLNGRERVRGEFSMENHLATMERLYKSVLSKNTGE